jgi:hypothetical protein
VRFCARALAHVALRCHEAPAHLVVSRSGYRSPMSLLPPMAFPRSQVSGFASASTPRAPSRAKRGRTRPPACCSGVGPRNLAGLSLGPICARGVPLGPVSSHGVNSMKTRGTRRGTLGRAMSMVWRQVEPMSVLGALVTLVARLDHSPPQVKKMGDRPQSVRARPGARPLRAARRSPQPPAPRGSRRARRRTAQPWR